MGGDASVGSNRCVMTCCGRRSSAPAAEMVKAERRGRGGMGERARFKILAEM